MWYSLEHDLWTGFSFAYGISSLVTMREMKSVAFERRLFLPCNLRQKERVRGETIRWVTRSRSGVFRVHKEQSRLLLGHWRENKKSKGLSSGRSSGRRSFNTHSCFMKG